MAQPIDGARCEKCGRESEPDEGEKPTEVKRVCGQDKQGNPLPKYRISDDENGVSTFDGRLSDDQILAPFREGSTIDTKTVAEIESRGMSVVRTHGDCDLLETDELQDNHYEIRPGAEMDRVAFKKALKTL